MGIVHLAGAVVHSVLTGGAPDDRQLCALCGSRIPAPNDPALYPTNQWPVDSLVTVVGNLAERGASRFAVRCSRSLLEQDDAA